MGTSLRYTQQLLPRCLKTLTQRRIYCTASPCNFETLLQGNSSFAKSFLSEQPELAAHLSQTQTPHTLWLGCSDSRGPETTITGALPGEIFTHRNIANLIREGDTSSAAVIQFAVKFLGVKNVAVVGHSKCGGANAALGDDDLGEVLNKWLEPIRQLRRDNIKELDALSNTGDKAVKLAEYNVLAGIEVVKKHPAVTDALAANKVVVHGLIYDIDSATLRKIF